MPDSSVLDPGEDGRWDPQTTCRHLTKPLAKTTTKSQNRLAAMSVDGKTQTPEPPNPKALPNEDRNGH